MHKWKQNMKNNDMWACECIGPQNGEPRCPCQMKNVVIRDGRYKRFFVSKRFSKREMLAICLLRHKTTRRIIEVLLQINEIIL